MVEHTLHAFLSGADFSLIAEAVLGRSEAFIRSREWICPRIEAVNEQATNEDGELEWTLGISLDLPDLQHQPLDWFSDVEAIATFAAKLWKEFQVPVILGMTDNRSGCREDILEIDSGSADIEYLRRYMGVAPPFRSKPIRVILPGEF